MGIYFPLREKKVGVDWPVTAVFYNRNASLALYADLVLMLRRGAHMLAFVLKQETHRLALKLKHKATQACILKSSMIIAFSTERDPRAVLLMKCDVRVWVETQPSHWHEICVWGFNFSNFDTAYRTPSKVFETLWLTGKNLEILWTSYWLEISWMDWQSFEMIGAWSCLHSGLHQCIVELVDASIKDHHKYLKTQFRTFSSLIWLSMCCWTSWIVDPFC